MARAIWSGVMTFGLVSVPVDLYSATEAHGPVMPSMSGRDGLVFLATAVLS